MICTVEGCERRFHARGLCNAHYKCWRTHGVAVLPSLSTAERLAAELVKMPNGCLEWTGPTGPRGYGWIWITTAGKRVMTHRLAWTLVNGPIPDGLCILHHCDNPPCVETTPTEAYPDGHLFLGTKADNVADMIAKGRGSEQKKTHCKHGHPFDEANTRVKSDGRRECKVCRKAIRARYKQRLALAS